MADRSKVREKDKSSPALPSIIDRCQEHRRGMLHRRKAQLIQLAFEKDLTHKFTSEWKDMLMRRFSSEKRRLPLRTGREGGQR
ncbi:unnamed protein product [Boreogadus saida]